MTEREPMSSKEQLKEAYMAGVAHHTNEEVGFPEETFSRWYDALASTEPEQPASKEARKERLMEASARVNDFARKAVLDLADRLDAVASEPSTTEGEREKTTADGYLDPGHPLRDFEEAVTALDTALRRDAGDVSAQRYWNAKRKVLALLAQPTAPGKKWTPAALEEWTPEQWADALDAARSDLMCAEDFEPDDVAHVMNICAQVLRRPREQGDPNDCRDCGAPHWYNFMVPDDVWEKIAPDQPCLPEEGGMLCAQCIDKRCAALGIEAEGKFYFKGEAVVSRYPEEQGEQIEGWAVNTWMALWEFAANDENFTPGPASKPATLIIHPDPPEQGECE